MKDRALIPWKIELLFKRFESISVLNNTMDFFCVSIMKAWSGIDHHYVVVITTDHSRLHVLVNHLNLYEQYLTGASGTNPCTSGCHLGREDCWTLSQVFVLTTFCFISFSLTWTFMVSWLQQISARNPYTTLCLCPHPLVFSLALACGIIYTVQMCSSCLWSKRQVMWRTRNRSINNTEALCSGLLWHSNKQNFCKWYRFGDRHLLAPTQRRLFLSPSQCCFSLFLLCACWVYFSLVYVCVSHSPFFVNWPF